VTTGHELPDQCPKYAVDVRLRPQVEKSIGGSRKEWRCTEGCVSWAAR
jgi:hypothetical protein